MPTSSLLASPTPLRQLENPGFGCCSKSDDDRGTITVVCHSFWLPLIVDEEGKVVELEEVDDAGGEITVKWVSLASSNYSEAEMIIKPLPRTDQPPVKSIKRIPTEPRAFRNPPIQPRLPYSHQSHSTPTPSGYSTPTPSKSSTQSPSKGHNHHHPSRTGLYTTPYDHSLVSAIDKQRKRTGAKRRPKPNKEEKRRRGVEEWERRFDAQKERERGVGRRVVKETEVPEEEEERGKEKAAAGLGAFFPAMKAKQQTKKGTLGGGYKFALASVEEMVVDEVLGG